MRQLSLPYNSPFVDVRVGIQRKDYNKMVENLDYYMSIAPVTYPKPGCEYCNIDWIGREGRIDFPRFWYDDIVVQGFHYENQEIFFQTWERRRLRYNPNKKLILKVLYDESDIERFEAINNPLKLGFYYKKTNYDNIILVNSGGYAYQYSSAIYWFIEKGELFKNIDILELLKEV